MAQDFNQIFSYFSAPQPSDELAEKILGKIKQAQKRKAKIRLAVFAVVSVLSVVALVPAGYWLWQDVSQSGFFQFVSLLFSDFGMVLAYWHNFVLAVLESLPVLSLIVFSGVAVLLLESIRSLSRNIKIIDFHLINN